MKSQSQIQETINPESPVQNKEVKIDIRASEVDMQSQLSTNFDTQSLKDIDSLPSLSAEIQSLPKLITEGRKASSISNPEGLSLSCSSKLTSNSSQTLPSDKIRELMQPVQPQPVQPDIEPAEVTPEQFMSQISPYFDFEERIDESERKIKFESARYSKLVENKIYY